MTALVTGTKGFIGKRLKEALDVLVLEMNEDVFDYSNWQEVVLTWLDKYKPDVVFHVGACSDTMEIDVNYIMTRNYEFTRILTDWCYSNTVPIIYSSSAANYGTSNLYPSNLYGWSKYVGEQYVLSRGGIALRYFNVYGPGEEHKGKMASMAYQMYKAGETKLFRGEPKRDFVYVDDVVSANIFAWDHYVTLSGNKYDVGFGKAHTFEYIAHNLDIPYTYHDDDAIPKGYQFYTCSNHFDWMPGWVPKYSLKKGLTLCKMYWQKQPTNQENGQCSSEDGNLGTQDIDG